MQDGNGKLSAKQPHGGRAPPTSASASEPSCHGGESHRRIGMPRKCNFDFQRQQGLAGDSGEGRCSVKV